MKNITFLESIKKMPLMSLPVRTTIVSLKGGNVMISPGSNLQIDQLSTLSNVTDIIVPNLFHTAGVPKAINAYPNAKVWKAGDAWPFQEELSIIPINGMPTVNEFAFYHKESKSLIVTDLCFNLIHASGVGAWIILNFFGTYRQFGVSKLFVKLIKNKSEFKKSMNQIFSYDFNNIIMAHGELIQGNGKALLEAALQKRNLF